MNIMYPTTPDGNAYRIMVSPEMAEMWYKTSPGNRPISDRGVRRYAADMKAGKWYATNDAVIFDTNGRLRNAHHRMLAIQLAGVSVPMLVRSGVPEEEIPHMDQGIVRTTVQAVTSFTDEKPYGDIDCLDTSIMRLVLDNGRGSERFSHHVLGQSIYDHRELLDFVVEDCFRGERKRGMTAPVYAVFVRAAYNREIWDKLRYAGGYLVTGGDEILKGRVQPLKGTCWLRVLRDFCTVNIKKRSKGRSSGSGPDRRMLYTVALNCLSNFLAEDDRSNPRIPYDSPKTDLFPIPEKPYLAGTRCVAPQVQYMIGLRKVAARYADRQLVTPNEIAEHMIQAGVKSVAKHPVKSVAGWFSRVIKQNNHTFRIENIGCFVPATENPNPKRVNQYRFVKDYV